MSELRFLTAATSCILLFLYDTSLPVCTNLPRPLAAACPCLPRRRADATRILREIKLLRLLRHPDIVEIKHIMLPPSARDFKDIYVVFELMETDLHQVGGWGCITMPGAIVR